MAVGFPAYTSFTDGTALPAAKLDDLAGTLNLLNPSAKGSHFFSTAANTPYELLVGAGGPSTFSQVVLADSAQSAGVRWGDDLLILQIMQAI